MKNKLISAFCIFVSFIFIISIGIFCFNIYSEYSHGDARCSRRFEHLSLNVNKLLNSNDVNSRDFDNKMLNTIGNLNDFAILKIKYNNQIIFSYPANLDFEEISSSKLTKEMSNSFTVNDDFVSIYSSLFLLRPSEISHFAKISFLLILIVTIITFIIIIFVNNSSKYEKYQIETINNIKTDENIPEKESETVEQQEPVKLNTIDEILCENNFISPKNATSIKNTFDVSSLNNQESIDNSNTRKLTDNINLENKIDTSNIENSTEEKNISQTINETKCPLPENFKEDTSEVLNEKVQETEINKTSNIPAEPLPIKDEIPESIITQHSNENSNISSTGLLKESILNQKLDTELSRAISSEIDLALFIIKLPCIEKNSKIFSEIVEYLQIQFQYKDLLFEYKEDSIAAIKINNNTSEAINFAEKLLDDINEMLQEYPSKCFIGISTRTLRIMSAERLIKEANEALNHAQEDIDCNIIAFQADVLKYQQYLEYNN